MNALKNFKIATKINLLVIVILLLFSLVLGLVVQNLVSSGVKESAVEKAKSDLALSYIALDQQYPGHWAVEDGVLYKGNIQVNENFEMVDFIANITGGSVTIFQEDTRVSTSVVVDGNRAVGTQASDEIIQKVLKGGQHFYGEANVAGTLNQTAYQPIQNENGETIGMWFVGVSQDFIDETIASIINGFLVVLVIGIVLAFLVVLWFSKQIKQRLSYVGNALEKAGQGDFTIALKDSSKDEIGILSQSYNNMRDSLRTLINNVVETAEQVAASSEQLTAGAEETSKATDQISESIQAIASGSESQLNHMSKTNQAAGEISSGMEQISGSIQTVNESSGVTKEKSKNGRDVIQQTITQMRLINDKTEEISTVVKQLGNKSTEIGKIVSLITAVSEQTNLLALNAAIEAARAGEHGKGFAVVADEVRKLAEQSSGSASQINSLIQDIQSDISKSVLSMDEASSAVNDGITFVDQAGDEFEEISVSVSDVSTQIAEVSAAIQQITAEMEAMVTYVDEASKIAEESASNSQEVAASAEEQNATMEEVASASATLSNLAEGLQESVRKFKL
ncbi:methyl-accepting chemotaxis protein [Sutcliffiella cohnii]